MEKYRKVMALLTQRQAEFLEIKSKEGYSKVEILRRALDDFIEKSKKPADIKTNEKEFQKN